MQTGFAVLAGTRRHMLPLKKKPHEVCGRDGLNLLAQFSDGAAMDPGEQPAMTPLGIRDFSVRAKAAAEHLSLDLETE